LKAADTRMPLVTG